MQYHWSNILCAAILFMIVGLIIYTEPNSGASQTSNIQIQMIADHHTTDHFEKDGVYYMKINVDDHTFRCVYVQKNGFTSYSPVMSCK